MIVMHLPFATARKQVCLLHWAPGVQDLQAKWDKVENKPQVALYAAGAVFALFLTSTVINAINNVPLVRATAINSLGGARAQLGAATRVLSTGPRAQSHASS
jgi:hypothetical protein